MKNCKHKWEIGTNGYICKKCLVYKEVKPEGVGGWEETFNKQFRIGIGRKWIFTQDEAKEMEEFISNLLLQEKAKWKVEKEKIMVEITTLVNNYKDVPDICWNNLIGNYFKNLN